MILFFNIVYVLDSCKKRIGRNFTASNINSEKRISVLSRGLGICGHHSRMVVGFLAAIID